MEGGAQEEGQAGPIVVYGASGYTGKLIAAELTRRGAEIVLAGRNAEKLDRVATGLESRPATAAVPLDDRAGLRKLLEPAAAVIACAGPFTLHGEPVIEAAAEVGTHYLDTTGEQPFIRDAFERWDAAARTSGAALVSGMGFDYAPGDMLAGLTAEPFERVDELTVAYSIRGFGATRGTALSALEMIKGGDVEYRSGSWEQAPRNVGRGCFPFPSPIGSRRVGRYPAGEQITVPRHVEVDRVNALIDLRSVTPRNLGPLSAPTMSFAGLAMATPARSALGRLIGKLPEGPSEIERAAVRFTIVCDVHAGGKQRRGVVRGGDVYGTTAVLLAEAAQRVATPGYEKQGALAPAAAFDPAAFLAAIEPHGMSVELGEPS
jgi:short subunit dehydrogenase-like uncharacterized protein